MLPFIYFFILPVQKNWMILSRRDATRSTEDNDVEGLHKKYSFEKHDFHIPSNFLQDHLLLERNEHENDKQLVLKDGYGYHI